MANFDLTTYPLSDRTRMDDILTVARDVMDDGTLGVRVLGDDTWRVIGCEFEPMSESTSAAFSSYLITNRATELDMVFTFGSPLETYRGYIWSAPRFTIKEGIYHIWRFDFRGQRV
jgi:hypothetical protein